MNTEKLRNWLLSFGLLIALVGAHVPPATATIMYNNSGPFFSPLPALPGLPAPRNVPGKEYSHDPDQSAMPPGGIPDPAQVINWDGKGGTADGFDYSLPAPPFSTSGNFQVDALAATHDALFNETMADRAHLVFSVDDMARTTLPGGLLPVAVPAAGKLTTPDMINGGVNTIGGAGELSFERGRFGGLFPANVQGVWATQSVINGMPLPRDVDGVELWGGEPGQTLGDADKYSVDTDISTGAAGPAFAVWNRVTQTGYVPLSMVVDLVANLLDIENVFEPDDVNLDALMVMDGAGTNPNLFEPGDRILFSIRQLEATFAPDGSGFLATGSEIFWLDGASMPAALVGGFLDHGGHLWDKKYALENMTTVLLLDGNQVRVQLDLNALEAVAGVPEPGGALLLLLGSGIALRRRRRPNFACGAIHRNVRSGRPCARAASPCIARRQ
jgi:hypothetical protein